MILEQRYVGASVYGLRMPIIQQGDDIAEIISDTLMQAGSTTYQPIELHNKDILGITESFLARSQGNYITLDDIADDVTDKFPTGDVAVAFPILSRNRFAKVLEGIVKGVNGKVYVCLSYPSDEVGNALMDEEDIYRLNLNPYADVLTKKEFREKVGTYLHPITKTDYLELYQSISEKIEIVLLNNPKDILKLTNQIIVASIHTRHRHKKMLIDSGANVITLEEICNTPSESHGWSEFGLLGSNYADSNRLKLFPRDAESFCNHLQKLILSKTGKTIEVMIYGDGGFKCPKTKIWEFADPVVSPGFTSGLKGALRPPLEGNIVI